VLYGCTEDGTLDVFQNFDCLCWEARLPITRKSIALARQVRNNTFRQCSVMFTNWETTDRPDVDEVIYSELAEISITQHGAMPATACWASDELLNETPPNVRAARPLWSRCRMESTLAARRPKGQELFAQVDAFLARKGIQVPV
jgi:hypothetical protein